MGQKQTTKSKVIDKQIKADKNNQKHDVVVQLVGLPGSGKSTFFKQCKVVSGRETLDQNKLVSTIHFHCTSQITILIESAKDFGFELGEKEKRAVEEFKELLSSGVKMSQEMANLIEIIWGDQGIRNAYLKGKGKELHEQADYFFDNIQRIAQPDYVPTQTDFLLKSELLTPSIEYIRFTFENLHLNVFNIECKKAAKPKWLSCFDGPYTVVFVVSLICYDMVLPDNENKNAMEESLELFKEVFKCSNKKTGFFLFFNKTDLFDEKCTLVPIKVCKPFSDYAGKNDPDSTKEFIRNKFLDITATVSAQHLKVHFSSNLATNNIQHLVTFVRTSMLGDNISEIMSL